MATHTNSQCQSSEGSGWRGGPGNDVLPRCRDLRRSSSFSRFSTLRESSCMARGGDCRLCWLLMGDRAGLSVG